MCLVLFVSLAVLAFPNFMQRINAEAENSAVCLSLDYSSLAEDFADDEIRGKLLYAKKNGIKTVSLGISAAKNDTALENIEGFDTALFIDEYSEGFSYAELAEKLFSENSLRHVSVCKDDLVSSMEFLELMDFISDKGINLVFMENESQSANEGGFDKFPHTANASYMRCYNTSYSQNDKIDTNRRFHQMLNSFKDRNTHFVNIVPFEDMSASAEDNFVAAILSADMFLKETQSMGCPLYNDNIDYSDYKADTAFNMSLAAVLSVLLCYVIFSLVSGRRCLILDIFALVLAVVCIVFAYLFTRLAQLAYPLMLAVSLACFVITAFLLCAKGFKDKSFIIYITINFAVLLSCLSIAGYFLSSSLSGVEYYMYFYTFRGVKLALLVPVLYAGAAYLYIFGIQIPKIRLSALSVLAFVLLASATGAVVLVYLMRSGNSSVSGAEIAFRDWIDTLLGIRPRTKEFLIGYPSFLLALWYFKYTRQSVFLLALTLGVGILAGSVVNSFCHVFTPTLSIYQRSINGIILGAPLAALALGANAVFYKIISKK